MPAVQQPAPSSRARKRARLRQTFGEWERLDAAIRAWIGLRTERDKSVQKHTTQLRILGELLNTALGALNEEWRKISATDPIGAVYAACRVIELRLTWVERIWSYYREKFDQRDDTEVAGPVLEAADELLWSCYAPAFRALGRKPPSAPLPYIEPLFSPNAVPRDNPPPELRSSFLGPFQQQFLRDLPIPLIGLPPSCIDAPWWLAVIAHEAGHHIQYDLAPKRDLILSFGAMLEQHALADPTPGRADRATLWLQRSQEIFADMYSVCCVGDAAVRTIAELEDVSDTGMVNDARSAYPAPLVRLWMLAAFAGEAPAGAQELAGLDPEVGAQATQLQADAAPPAESAGVQADLVLAQTLLTRLRTEKIWEQKSLPELGFRLPNAGQQRARWAKDFLADHDVTIAPNPAVDSARALIGGAVLAWAHIVANDDENTRDASLARVRARLLPAIRAGREPGTRAGAPATEVATEFAEQFTASLIQAHPTTLQT